MPDRTSPYSWGFYHCSPPPEYRYGHFEFAPGVYLYMREGDPRLYESTEELHVAAGGTLLPWQRRELQPPGLLARLRARLGL